MIPTVLNESITYLSLRGVSGQQCLNSDKAVFVIAVMWKMVYSSCVCILVAKLCWAWDRCDCFIGMLRRGTRTDCKATRSKDLQDQLERRIKSTKAIMTSPFSNSCGAEPSKPSKVMSKYIHQLSHLIE